MKYLPWLLFLLFFASCAGPQRAVQMPTVRPPAKGPNVEESVRAVGTASRAVESSNRALQRRVVDLSAASREASSAASRAESEAKRLATQKSATEDELFNLSKIMEGVAQRNMFLETSVIDLKDKIVEQEELIVEQVLTINKAQVDAAKVRVENTELRSRLDEANANTETANGEVGKAQAREAQAVAKLEQAEKRVARMMWYRHVVWGLGALLGLYLFIRFALPLILKALGIRLP